MTMSLCDCLLLFPSEYFRRREKEREREELQRRELMFIHAHEDVNVHSNVALAYDVLCYLIVQSEGT